MSNQALASSLGRAAGVLGVVAIGSLPIWGLRAGLGVLAGGLWSLMNLWCLTRLLAAWLGAAPTTRRVLAWLLVKFPLLYAVAWACLASLAISPTAFGVGFTVALAAVLILLARMAHGLVVAGPHER